MLKKARNLQFVVGVCKNPTKQSTAQSTHALCKVKGYPEILSPKFDVLNFCTTRPKKHEQETSVNLASMIRVNAFFLQGVQ